MRREGVCDLEEHSKKYHRLKETAMEQNVFWSTAEIATESTS